MRLGDLDALKTKIEINFSRKPEAQAIYKHLIDIIEDAPTVCGNNSKWCESCVSKGKCASTRPQGDCEKCDYRKVAERFVDGIADFMKKNDISSFEQLSEILRGGNE